MSSRRIFPLQKEIYTSTASEISHVEGNRRVILLSLDLQGHEQGKPHLYTAPHRGENLQEPGKPTDGRLFKFCSFIDKWTPPWRLDLHCWVFAGEVLLAKHPTNKDQSTPWINRSASNRQFSIQRTMLSKMPVIKINERLKLTPKNRSNCD